MPHTIKGLHNLGAKAQEALKKINKTSKAKIPKVVTRKTLKSLEAQCVSTYCNPGCKNTMFSTRKNTEAMKRNNIARARAAHKDPAIQKMMVNLAMHTRKKMRKVLWHRGASPLKDSFYKNLDPKDVKAMKAKGAESGCTIMLPNDMFKLIGRTMNDLAN